MAEGDKNRAGTCCDCGTAATPVGRVGAPAGEHDNPTTGQPCDGISLSTN
jgi:hypothetical protein